MKPASPRLAPGLALALLLPAAALAAPATVSAEFGFGDKSQIARLGVQFPTAARWLAGDGKHLGSYWDLTAAFWRERRYLNVPGRTSSFGDFGVTPVLRYGRDDGRGLYAEGGIGIHYLSRLYNNNDDRLSTHLQFGDHLAVGMITADGWDFALKLQHFSNGGIRKPNSGVNFLIVKAAHAF
jgi:lipid A 3-O-deacylase